MGAKPWSRNELHPRCVILAGLIRAERLKRGWSLEETAECLKITRHRLARIENARIDPPANLLCRMEDLFAVRMSELWLRAFRQEAGLIP